MGKEGDTGRQGTINALFHYYSCVKVCPEFAFWHDIRIFRNMVTERKRKEKIKPTYIVIFLNSERGIRAIILTRIYLTLQL